MIKKRKCAILGCGFVGATTAYALMKSRLFSEMVLLDIDQKKVMGEAEDLCHGLSFNSPMDIYAGSYEDLADCSIIILAAGAGQKEGESRLDLLAKNARIFEDIIKNICRVNREAILLVVTNPVDVLTHVTLTLSGFPKERVIGSGTVLDTARLKYQLGKRFQIDARNVHALIIGEHGDSELPVFSSANISGVDLVDFCEAGSQNDALCSPEQLEPLFEEVKNSAYRIIEGKGATYYAIAEATLRIVAAIVRDERTVLPVSTYVKDYCGVHDVCIGVPCIIGKNGVEDLLKIPLSDTELAKFKHSAAVIREAINSLHAIH